MSTQRNSDKFNRYARSDDPVRSVIKNVVQAAVEKTTFEIDKGRLISCLKDAITGTLRRCLVITTIGQVGLAPRGTRCGDEVCILFGGDVPYIVRDHDDHHQFIGECYVQGIMDGEAVTKDPLKEKWYTLR